MSINKAIILGNLAKDPELRTFETGSICTFSVATNRPKFKASDGREIPEKTEFHNIVVRGKLADVCNTYLRKGNKVYLEGEIWSRSYEVDGGKRYVTEIYATKLEFLTPKQQTGTESAPENAGSNSGDDDDDLPF